MSISIIQQLPELRPHSNKRLPITVTRIFRSAANATGLNAIQLIEQKRIANANWGSVPRDSSQSILQVKNRQAIRKVMSLPPGIETNYTYQLNTALLGSRSYPVLTAVLGTVAGISLFNAGLFFTIATTGLSMSQKSQRALARSGDQIWQIEEIGKVRSGNELKAMHINSYFLVDPFRRQNTAKGWLIHEERTDIIL